MKHSILSAALLAWALLAGACGRRTAPADFDEAVYAPRYAADFEIAGAEGAASTLLRVRDPWQGAEGVETSLLILRNGEPVPEGFEGQVLRGDARRVVCMSSSHVAMLDAVGAVDAVVGVSGLESISCERLLARRERVGDVGYEGDLNYELLVALDPDLVLLYGVGGASGMEPRLRELEIPFLYVGDYLEESPLGKAEWMVALGETVGRRAEAEAAFSPIPERYEALRRRVAEKAADSPTVMLNTPYGDSWFMPCASSCIARLIADAGGRYVYARNDSGRSQPVDREQAWLLASEADVWLHAQASTLDELKARLPAFADTRCVRGGDVWNCDRRTTPGGGNDYWESGVVRPDAVLRDLVKILHPELVGDELVYYRRLE